jgi:hypothetical protein
VSKTGNYPYPKADEEEDWEDSNTNSNKQNESEDSNHSTSCNSTEYKEYKECEGMEYDDASGEVAAAPRKWGKWFNAVRKDDEEDEFLDEFQGCGWLSNDIISGSIDPVHDLGRR